MKPIRFVVLFGLVALLGLSGASARCENIMVSAAASMTDVFKEEGLAFQKRNPGVKVDFNFGASGVLAAQIEQGAPVDVFVSAASIEMDRLQKKGLIIDRTRKDVVRNTLVVIVPDKSSIAIRTLKDLRGDSINRIAIGNPDTVPAGMYAMQAFKSANVAAAIQRKLVYGSDVRQARTYAMRAEVDAAVVFATDCGVQGIRIAYRIPDRMHDKIVYPAAVLRDSGHPGAARQFIQFLLSKAGRKILSRYGFSKPRG